MALETKKARDVVNPLIFCTQHEGTGGGEAASAQTEAGVASLGPVVELQPSTARAAAGVAATVATGCTAGVGVGVVDRAGIGVELRFETRVLDVLRASRLEPELDSDSVHKPDPDPGGDRDGDPGGNPGGDPGGGPGGTCCTSTTGTEPGLLRVRGWRAAVLPMALLANHVSAAGSFPANDGVSAVPAVVAGEARVAPESLRSIRPSMGLSNVQLYSPDLNSARFCFLRDKYISSQHRRNIIPLRW